MSLEEGKLRWTGSIYDDSFFGYHCNLVAEQLLSKFDVKEKMNVLDAGSGTGAITLNLLKKHKNNINITSVDFSEAMIETLKNVSEKIFFFLNFF